MKLTTILLLIATNYVTGQTIPVFIDRTTTPVRGYEYFVGTVPIKDDRSPQSVKIIYSESRKEAIKKVNDFCIQDSVICVQPIAIENRGHFHKAEIIYRKRLMYKIVK